MLINMLSFSGLLSRKQYWYTMLVLFLEFVAVFLLLFFVLDTLDAETPGTSTFIQVISVVTFSLLALNSLFVLVALLGAIMRRARDAGNTVLLTAVAILVPLGWLVLGLVPTKRSKP